MLDFPTQLFRENLLEKEFFIPTLFFSLKEPLAMASNTTVPSLSNQEQITGNRPFLLDLSVIVLISAAISTASHQLFFMTLFVPVVLALRFALWALLPREEKSHSFPVEALFFLICLVLGAFNDWNSVHYHKIYNYTVPQYFPQVSQIPFWMLLYWGMILRFLSTLFTWSPLSPSPEIRNTISLFKKKLGENPWAKVGIILLLVALTRQCIYRFYLHPIFSWLPFALALVLYLILFPPDRHDLKLLGIFLLGGPAIEILYIQVGGLHHYHLGWIGGVPLWIALWWLVIVLIWKDFSKRILEILPKA